MKFIATFVAAAVLSTAALAQAPAKPVAEPKVVGQVKSLKGLVTVSQGDSMSSSKAGDNILDGSRFVVAADGEALLQIGSCQVKLKGNEALLVDGGQACAALVASIRSTAVPVTVPSTVVAGGASVPAAAAVGGIVATGFLLSRNSSTPISSR